MHLVNELTFSTCKNFGMFGQIGTSAIAVSREELTIRLSTRHPREGDEIARNVANAFINHLGGLLPVQRLRVVYSNPTLGIEGEEHVFPMPSAGGRLSSQVILVEPVAGPHREKFRKPFADGWKRLERGQ